MKTCVENGGEILYVSFIREYFFNVPFFQTDTDSVIYKAPRNKTCIETGEKLGEMSQEYKGYEILEFIAGGAKQYSLKMRCLKTNTEKYDIKLRGITLDEQTSHVINGCTFRKHVMENIELRKRLSTNFPSPLYAHYNSLRADRKGGVKTIKITKKYDVICNKGYLDSSCCKLYPFGY